MWLSAELLAWGGPSVENTRTYQVRVFKAGVDPKTPSDGTQPTRPDKEQLRLEALRAAKESWLQALCAASLASCARHDAGGDNDFNYDSHTLLIQTFARGQ